MEIISSVQNQKVKQWVKLHNRKEREKMGRFLVEGEHLVEEAMRSGEVETLLLEEGRDLPLWFSPYTNHVDQVILSAHVMSKIAETDTPQGIAAIVKMPEGDFQPSGDFLLLLLDRVQDPGNLGTLIRSADAAGFHGVAVGKGSSDLFNGKAIRASMGSLFHLPVFPVDTVLFLHRLRQSHPDVKIIGTSLLESLPYNQISYEGPTVIVIGNEGSGVSQEVLALADQNVIIPIYGKAESLNAAIAGSILMYEAARQRQKRS